ncbi:MAG: DEAD/DEAH box helicase [Clostridiaceae bacterium]|nr:DEAD/DEAH box helicase [Clostridiaceae bacterium]
MRPFLLVIYRIQKSCRRLTRRPKEIHLDFSQLGLSPRILEALDEQGYSSATPIQEASIPTLMTGRDLLGCAQTGTGKTAAFALPILQKLGQRSDATGPSVGRRRIRTLVLAPTRELAIQINDCFIAYGRHLRLRSLVIFGGVSQNPQVRSLQAGVDILVATPGRLLDLMDQGYIKLDNVEFFVLDEADRMLDMGMIHDVRRIVSYLPSERQTMFFSATMPSEIEKLAGTILSDPYRIDITPPSSTVDTIGQTVYRVDRGNKIHLLVHLLNGTQVESALVFSRTKHGADKIVRALQNAGLSAQAIHGNKSQNARQDALGNFKNHKTRILVATDIAARGIDVEELSHVIQFDLPEVPETYVHRIGRTGRAGLGGTAYSFCCGEEFPLLRDIQKLIRKELPIEKDHPYPMTEADALSAPPAPQSFRPEGRYNQRGGNPRSGNSGSGATRSAGPRKGHPRRQYARRGED